MSIKGRSQELFIGKTEINIQDYQWTYKLKKFRYEDISHIEYCFRTMTEGGYMDFHDKYGHFERFFFPQKSNAAIQRAVDFISEHYPDLPVEMHDLSEDPFYSKNVFIGVISLFIFWPAGLALYWCTGKRTLMERVIYTAMILGLHITFACVAYWAASVQIQNAFNEVNYYLNQIRTFN